MARVQLPVPPNQLTLHAWVESVCGVHFTELPRVEPWGKWAQFVDQDGNEFGLKE
jgi:hypothetical protein